jgi:RNA recognition motif-containing protein
MNLYVGNLPHTSTEAELRVAFEKFGTVSTAAIIKDKFSGESRGFGFVEMPAKAEAQAAMSQLNGKDFNGRALTVNEAKPREERGNSFGGGGRSSYGSGSGSGGGGRRY